MITDDTRLFVVNMRREGLGPVVLAPDVEHEDASDEEEGHDQDGDWSNLERGQSGTCIQESPLTNLDPGRVVSVKPPHSSTAGSSCPGSCHSPSSPCSLPLPSSSSSSSCSGGGGCPGAPCSHISGAGCWSWHSLWILCISLKKTL